MTLYYESANLIKLLDKSPDTSLKSLLFSKAKPGSDPTRKSSPAQLYALVTEAWKWGAFLKDIIERADLLRLEKKLTPELALVLVHDLVLAKKGIAAPENHVLRQAVERHRARLRAEFTKARIRTGCASIEELKRHVEQQKKAEEGSDPAALESRKWLHPRWLRINTLRAKMDLLNGDEFGEWKQVDSLREIISGISSSAATGGMVYYIDKHVPNLLALAPGTNLSAIPAYKRGDLISQDKASCFPAYLLSSGDAFQGTILDACAAPGNKTSHIAAIISEQNRQSLYQKHISQVLAIERDASRADILKRMLGKAGADHVKVHGSQDFLKVNVNQEPWTSVKAIILDPSCSGSGIIERSQGITFSLPSIDTAPPTDGNRKRSKNKKRKRQENGDSGKASTNKDIDSIMIDEQDVEVQEDNAAKLEARLKSLATLQTKMLIFAFSFPNIRRITYSTCSIHNIENEGVVIAALASQTARSCGWRMMRRDEQVEGLRLWQHRGRRSACDSVASTFEAIGLDTKEIAEACIRCEPLTEEGTQGFFVAGFVRDSETQYIRETTTTNENEDEQWTGFDD